MIVQRALNQGLKALPELPDIGTQQLHVGEVVLRDGYNGVRFQESRVGCNFMSGDVRREVRNASEMRVISSGLGLEGETLTPTRTYPVGHRNLFYQLFSGNLSVIRVRFAIIPGRSLHRHRPFNSVLPRCPPRSESIRYDTVLNTHFRYSRL